MRFFPGLEDVTHHFLVFKLQKNNQCCRYGLCYAPLPHLVEAYRTEQQLQRAKIPGNLYDVRSSRVMKRSTARSGDIQRRYLAARDDQRLRPEEESHVASEDEDSPAESSESLHEEDDEEEEEDDDPQYNNVCEYCRCRLSEDVSIYVYSKRDDVNADMAACTAPKLRLS